MYAAYLWMSRCFQDISYETNISIASKGDSNTEGRFRDLTDVQFFDL